jgi:periplasmic protein TonB
MFVRWSFGALAVMLLAGCSPAPPAGTKTDREGPRIRLIEKLNCNQLVHQEKPVYPEEARRKGIEGTVTLTAVITRTGEIGDVTVFKGDPLLVPAAIRAARKWRFTPCSIESEAVEVKVTLDISFRLNR